MNLSLPLYRQLAGLITERYGIKLPEAKITMLQGRLMSRVRKLRLNSLDDYARMIVCGDNPEEMQHLINAVSTNKTDFFREPQHFDFLRERVLPCHDLSRRFNIWSAACSSGEEAYTLSMLLSEHAEQNYGFDYQVLATDISTKVLERGVVGIYSLEQIEPVPMSLRRKYLLLGKGERREMVRIKPGIRRRVSFQQLNFMDDSYGLKTSFDVIFCRNVLIYFDRERQQAVINRLCRHLRPGGYLMIGHSESLNGMRTPVVPVATSVYRKPDAKVTHV